MQLHIYIYIYIAEAKQGMHTGWQLPKSAFVDAVFALPEILYSTYHIDVFAEPMKCMCKLVIFVRPSATVQTDQVTGESLAIGNAGSLNNPYRTIKTIS